jgi:hypothetical protein
LGRCDDADPDGQVERSRADGWLTDVLERAVSGRVKAPELHTLLPWTWAAANPAPTARLAA